MMRWIRWLFALAIAFVLAVFYAVNRQAVTVDFWPVHAQLETRAGLAMLVAGAVGFLLGAFVVWTRALPAYARLSEAESKVRALTPPPSEPKPPGTALAVPR